MMRWGGLKLLCHNTKIVPMLQGSDKTMLNKLHQKHGNNKNYLKPKSDMNTSFGLNHFAGVVFYDTRAFLEKNRDTFRYVMMSKKDCGLKWCFYCEIFSRILL